ncbi:helix-turn-helix domain-containing protein [Dongia sp.]|uniref:IclR family transcriptional regulator domain-containing protein n=1 Tax=Dongia sp. TaxID=1977262 RepID=UPI0035B217FB
MTSFKPVTAVLRAFDILGIVNRLEQPTFARIHKASGLSSATVVRMLETLEHAGMIAKGDSRAFYLPTSRTLELSRGYDQRKSLALAATPILAALQRQVVWPSDLAIFDNDGMVVVETSRGNGRLSFNRHSGFRAPLLGTSLGTAYLAFTDPTKRAEVLARLSEQPEPWNELARDPKSADSYFLKIARRGYGSMHPDYCRSAYDGMVSAIAVPVLVGNDPVAALNISFFLEAVSEKEAVKRYLAPLRAAADAIAAATGC